MMPAFQHLPEADKLAIESYVLEDKAAQAKAYVSTGSAGDSFRTVPYSISGYNKFITASGLPAVAPPWGTITAIDLNSGEQIWKSVLGNDDRLGGKAGAPTGTENYGGPVVTKGGLLFIGAARDGMFRVFNKRNGRLLLEKKLPRPNFATPAVYSVNGKQFIVLACGGGKLGTESGDSYVAFALP
jgi:quinoprotein glucose dehydrogenase